MLKAEAAKQSVILEAEGKRASLIAIAEADQERVEKKVSVAPPQSKPKAGASGQDRGYRGLAQAKAIEAQGLAEAAAILKKAEAWKQFNEAARLQTILEKLPGIIQASAPVFGAVAAPTRNAISIGFIVIEPGQRQWPGRRRAGSLPTLLQSSLDCCGNSSNA